MKRVPANRYVCFLILSVSGLIWDLYSKHAVFADLGYPGQSSEWVERYFGGWSTFRLYTSFNEGALWGIGQGYTWVFATLSVAAVAGVIYWLFYLGAAQSWWLTVSLALIMSGTLGNLYDRIGLHGCVDMSTGRAEPIFAVRDFLLFTFGAFHWPVFNFADVFLVTGAGMLVVQSFLAEVSVDSATSKVGEDAAPSTADLPQNSAASAVNG